MSYSDSQLLCPVLLGRPGERCFLYFLCFVCWRGADGTFHELPMYTRPLSLLKHQVKQNVVGKVAQEVMTYGQSLL